MKVLGMGNALVDILIRIDGDHFLAKHELPKGSMQLVDYPKASAVLEDGKSFPISKASGGSAANTIHGLAKLGIETAFLGKVGQDELGNFFKDDLIQNGVESKLLSSDTQSGMAVALISPDAERTFGTFLGAAVELSPEDLKAELFAGYDVFYIEGYLVQNHALIERAVQLAKEAGSKVCLDLAAYNVVEANLEFLKNLASKVDIVFANEEEAKALTQMEPEEALHHIAESAQIAVVKLGSKGSLVKTEGKVYTAGVIQANSIDTTGAGDLYAAGYLYGMAQGYSPDRCAEIGAITAGNVIEVIGPKMDDARWQNIKELIKA
jgi:sugar/nucleoside kinase (ribokinase family)